ncbi:acetyltransferase [Chryseobacterium taklimakanense]|uniref:acetyltransferase n=1 Tax=Chryseobacterium taklimakanense TaxID=536441 RepID=UPI001EF49138|nr:acetyltransferase [Chryseobacterium taklimakanense]MCG7281470.1 acetyltransferase [Chryseobacterium taklimakanense]
MLILGAKGFAKEVLEILHQNGDTENLCFYDDVSKDAPDVLFTQFKILKSEDEAKSYFENTDPRFTVGIGNPKLRKQLYDKFTKLGGKFSSVISSKAEIGSYGANIGKGCNILGGVRISNDVQIGKGTMLYYNSVITHDVCIGDFCEISPSVTILGRAEIGSNCQIFAGAIIFPDVKIGNNSVIAAGSVVRSDIPENVMAAGIPAVIKKNV